MVLHKAYMTRVLIETGFISNVEEGNRLDSEEGQTRNLGRLQMQL
jgi:N-acetylmuramoyl-L-alanine amidase